MLLTQARTSFSSNIPYLNTSTQLRMTMRGIFTLLAICWLATGFSQATGKIEYKQLGLSFEIPEGWVGQETQVGYMMGSNSVPGVILMLPHDVPYTLDQIKQQAYEGLTEQNGTSLKLSGELSDLGKQSVGGLFSGTLEWQPAKAYIIGMQNPHGLGMTIVAVTTAEQFNENYQQYAKTVMNSIQFRKPESKEDIGEWKEWMKNVKLTYMDSYSSVSPGVDGMTGGGYSLKKEIDLCGQGYFIYYGSSSFNVGSDNSSAYDHSTSNGNGSWDIIIGHTGQPTLVLKYNNGETASYTLTYEDSKLYLDGTRYFRTMKGEYAPSCN